MYYFMDSGPMFTGLALPTAGGIVLDVSSIWDILSSSGDTCDQSRKFGKIGPNFTEGKIFLAKDPRIFGLAL